MITFEEFRKSLQPVGAATTIDPTTRASIQAAAEALEALPDVTHESVAGLIKENPDWVPYLGLVCRLSQEKLKSALKQAFDSDAWKTRARSDPGSIVTMLDDQFGLLDEIVGQRERDWSFADVMVERVASRTNAAGTVGIGRLLEDQVEELVKAVGVPYEMRTEFVGRNRQTAPADVAIPAGGDKAEIVVGIKSFGSTGSKQTDAWREFEELANVRDRQFAFAFIDGIGWNRRQNDLRQILQLWTDRRLNGVFNLAMAAEFTAALTDAARRTAVLPAT